MSRLRPAAALVAIAALAPFAAPRAHGPALAGSETPPEGPPWIRDFRTAQRAALERGVPIFVYLTKTH